MGPRRTWLAATPGALLLATPIALLLATLGAIPAARAADTFTAPAYTDSDCQVSFGGSVLGLTPDMIGSVVGMPVSVSATPAPQTVVVVSLGQSVDQADVRSFLQFCGLNPVTWTDVLNPGDPAPALGSEATLDLTVIAALLPANTTLKTATIADGLDFLSALVNAGNACGLDGSDPTQWRRSQLDTPTGGCIATMSYAIFEQSLRYMLTLEGLTTTAQQDEYIADVEIVLAGLASSGVITLISSGDEGSGGCQPWTRGVRDVMAPQWPSTSANALSVGGTMWAPPTWNGAAITPTSYVPGATLMPVTWRNWNMGSDCDWVAGVTEWPGIGTTGGISAFATRPDYQDSVAGIAPSSTGRLSPDLAALAGWPTWLVPIYTGAGVTYSMGTSAAAPLVAAGLAQVNAALTSRGLAPLDNSGGAMDVHEVIYSPAFASAFNDVTQGTNNLWSSDLWTGPTAVTTVPALTTLGFLSGGVPVANGSGTMTGYSAGVGYDLTTGMGVPNFSTLAQLLIDAQRPAPGGPPPVLQQLPAPDSGSCDLTITTYDWGGSSSGGWTKSWAQWANDGTGGAVCTRTLVYSSALRHWIVQR
jgi:subtilase family serine protease